MRPVLLFNCHLMAQKPRKAREGNGPRPEPSHHSNEVPHDPPLPFRQKMIYVVTVAAGVAAALALLWMLRWVFTLTFAAVLLAVFLRGGADLMGRLLSPILRLGPNLRLALFVCLLIGSMTGFAFLAAPSLTGQAAQLRKRVPQAVESFREQLRESRWGAWLIEESEALVGQMSPATQPTTAEAAQPFARTTPSDTRAATRPGGASGSGPDLQSLLRLVVRWAGGAVTVIISVLFLVFAALYMAAEPDLYRRGVLWLVPPRGREQAQRVLDRVDYTLRHWLMGQLAAMAIVGVLIGLGLWALGAPLPLLGGAAAALLEFVPNVGPVVAAGVPTLLALAAEGRFLSGPSLAMAVLLLFLLVQMLESYLLTPLIQRRVVELPPALLIVTQLAAGVLLGPIGVAIAAPLVASAMAVTRELFVVGDPDREHPNDRAGDAL